MAEKETDERSKLQRLLDRQAELRAEVEPLIAIRETEHTEFEARIADKDETKRPTADERSAFTDAEKRFEDDVKARLAELGTLNLRIEKQQLIEATKDLAARAGASEGRSVTITHQPEVYARSRDKNAPSFYLDVAMRDVPSLRSEVGPKGDGYAERLQAHSKMWEELLPKREAQRARVAERQAEAAEREFRGSFVGGTPRGFDISPFEQRALEQRAPTRLPGQGGDFIPPVWYIDEYIPYLRAGRVAADMVRRMPLPAGTDSINVPKLTGPTAIGIQALDNAPIPSADIQTGFINAAVKTLAGFADLPIQLIEQAPGTIIDEVIGRDMMGAYNVALDAQVIAGNGSGAPLSGGQIVGMYPSSRWGATQVVWNAGSPTGQGYFQALGAVASKVAQTRFNLKDFAFLSAARRWFWAATALDTQNRFLVGESAYSPMNSSAMTVDTMTDEGYVGRVPFGLKMYIDLNMPTNDAGHSTSSVPDADFTIGAIWDDLWLFEGEVRTNVFTETLSGTLQIRYRLHNYVAFLQRYGPSVAILTGTGNAPPLTIDGTAY